LVAQDWGKMGGVILIVLGTLLVSFNNTFLKDLLAK